MSNSEGLGSLVINGPEGAEIRILDAEFAMRHRGTVRLEAHLPAGLYLINWRSGGELQQKPVLVEAGGRQEIDPPAPSSPAPLGLVSHDDREDIREVLRPSEITAGRSDIIVVVLADDAETAAPLVRLFSQQTRAVALRSDREGKRAAQGDVGDAFVARVYHVEPGVYRLQYTSTAGQTVSQSVPALVGRRTVVVLRTTVGNVLVKNGEKLDTRRYPGVDPSQTVVLTLASGRPLAEYAEQARLASILVADLSTGRTSLGETLLGRLEAPDSDPIMRIMAASVMINRLEQKSTPALDASYPEGRSGAFERKWLRRAQGLMSIRPRRGMPSDHVLLRWRISGLLGIRPKFAALKVPPMFASSWRWAIEFSASDPRVIPQDHAFRGLERGIVTGFTWLLWRPAAAKAGTAISPTPASARNIGAELSRLANQTRVLLQSSVDRPNLVTAPVIESLSAESWTLAKAAMQSTFEGPKRMMSSELVRRVASVVQLPIGILAHLVNQALSEVETARQSQTGSSMPGDAGPPGLGRPITNPDDPQQGRFGGLSEHDGATLSAAFVTRRNGAVEITLTVRAPHIPDASEAHFFLHDTFEPDHILAAFERGEAVVELLAWGGFTVGVWIPNASTELELNLSKVPKAPRAIRDL